MRWFPHPAARGGLRVHTGQFVVQLSEELTLTMPAQARCPILQVHVCTARDGVVHATTRGVDAIRPACLDRGVLPVWRLKARHDYITCGRCYELIHETLEDHMLRYA